MLAPQYQLMQMLKQMEVVDMEIVEVTKEVVGPAMVVEAVEVEEETVTPTKTVPVMLHSAANTSSAEKQLSMEVMDKEEWEVQVGWRRFWQLWQLWQLWLWRWWRKFRRTLEEEKECN